MFYRSYFVNIWVVSFSFLSQLVFNILPGRQPLEYHLCTGTDPALQSDLIKVNITLFAVYIISMILNIAIPIKIHLFQIRNKNSCHSKGKDNNTWNVWILVLKIWKIKMETIYSWILMFFFLFCFSAYEQQSLTDLTTSISYTVLFGLGIAWMARSYQTDTSSLNKFPKYILTYFVQIVIPNLIDTSILIIYYSRNKRMRTFIIREIKEAVLPESCS